MILETEIEQLSTTIQHYKKLNNNVSISGVDWHLDHSLKVILTVCSYINMSDPKKYKWSFNFWRPIIFTIGHFPRGKARAPRITVSNEKITKEQLYNQFELVKIELSKIENLHKNSHFKHPIFGVLNLKQTHKFLKLHTLHHLKITNEIISSII